MADIEQRLLQQIMPEEANMPRMGEGAYATKSGRGPRGWDYDTLVSALTDMGHPTLDQEMSPDMMDQLLSVLEAGGANSNIDAIPLLQQFFENVDPNNRFAGHVPAMVEDSPGYWDAQNMGNGRGNSIINLPQGREDPRTVRADPIGNGAEIEDLIAQFLSGMQ
jgi:hypothetical protein